MTDAKKTNEAAYINVPFFVLQDKNLDPFDKLLFSYLWNYASAGKKIFISNESLATFINNVSERHIQDRLLFLETNGYIRRIRKGKRYIEVLRFENSLLIDSTKVKQTRTAVHDSTKVKQTRTAVHPQHEPQFVPNTNHSSPIYYKYSKSYTTTTQTTPELQDSSSTQDVVVVVKNFKHLETLKTLYLDNPVHHPLINSVDEFLDACDYALTHLDEDITVRGRVKGIKGFIKSGTFEPHPGWIKQRKKIKADKMNEENKKLQEEYSMKNYHEQIPLSKEEEAQKIRKDYVNSGMAEEMKKLKEHLCKK